MKLQWMTDPCYFLSAQMRSLPERPSAMNKNDNRKRWGRKRKRVPQKHYTKAGGRKKINRRCASDFKINFTGPFVYINNDGIPEYTLNSNKEYISINLW